ncbi:MAG: hypothetical protein ACF8AM_14640, partial [Rhodopirellula sp. JB055]|uniref:hypothetical protein n=1 Tax=Rhodopirellula sp. JB055 TaxID=3342846 RepID=UPI00370C8401
ISPPLRTSPRVSSFVRLVDWTIGRLVDWTFGRLEDWTIGRWTLDVGRWDVGTLGGAESLGDFRYFLCG